MNEDFIKAGEIAKKVKEFASGLLKENSLHLDIAEKIEARVISLGGQMAFPLDVSLNSIAAHDCPLYQDERKLEKGDIVKIDLGVHINGAVVDTAFTQEITTNKNQKLIDASKEALKAAQDIIKPKIEIWKIGEIIQKTITDLGFSPIINLSGHGVGIYEVHTAPTIPNYNNNNKNKLEEDMKIAIEPFATTGEGKVIEGKESKVYSLINKKNTRNQTARKILNFIEKNYKLLPFAERWLIKEFGLTTRIALNVLEREGILKQYNILPEKSKGLVSQAENTFIVGQGPIT